MEALQRALHLSNVDGDGDGDGDTSKSTSPAQFCFSLSLKGQLFVSTSKMRDTKKHVKNTVFSQTVIKWDERGTSTKQVSPTTPSGVPAKKPGKFYLHSVNTHEQKSQS